MLDRVESGPKPALVKELGATYHTGSIADLGLRPDIVLECTGVIGLVQQAVACVSPGGIVCLTGVGSADAAGAPAAALATEAVLKNLVVFGSVNANRRHYYRAAKELAAADRGWLEQLVTRRVGLEHAQEGLQRLGGGHQGDRRDDPLMTAGTGAGGAARGRRRSRGAARPAAGCSPRGRAGTPAGPSCCGSTSWPGRCTPPRSATTAASSRSAPLQVGRHVGAAAPAAAGGYVLAAAGGFWHADDDGAAAELAQPEAGRTDVRMNDGICDPQGRFWAGTMAYAETPGAGRLYRLELDGSCTLVLDGLTISNGMGWSPDGTTMYLADSGTGDVVAFDFDLSRRHPGPAQNLRPCQRARCRPDGLTVDSDGDVWVALERRCVARHHLKGRCAQTVPVPVDRPTSCLRRPRRATLFVTTSREGLDPAALARQPHAGTRAVHRGLGVTGPPCTPYRGPVIPP